MKVYAIVILSNANIDMFKGSIRLVVDKWGYIEVIEPVSFLVKDDKNHSLGEYKLANVPKVIPTCLEYEKIIILSSMIVIRRFGHHVLIIWAHIASHDRNVNFYNNKNIAIWATNSILFSHFKGTNMNPWTIKSERFVRTYRPG
ncbi:hypothetical protein IEQ34_008107 [Dendrobium chrysotoxum]|uniref:Single-stranded DNA binding protein Ssb-like OB fold domain-containing protein n=1 Tax=Dendrobium chrysotoxum TaxID=161865 RepID=A0AAV7H676_DENCH|nr:hypothetical protein IEQ34_008107 [Dendrobium chrysotoxum]